VRTIELEELAWHWRQALQAAQIAATASPDGHPPRRRHPRDLAGERKLVVDGLSSLARMYHLDVAVDHLALSATDVQRLLGLPSDATTCVFNLDGVLVPSAALHAAAWREAFDEFVLRRSERTRGQFTPFDLRGDYYDHIHARPRLEGARALLASRGIRLPEGAPDDAPGAETVHGLANRKREALLRRLRADRLNAVAGSRHYLEIAREAGLHRVVISASANAPQMLDESGLRPLVEVLVDGTTMEQEHLHAKPAPDALLAGCSKIDSDPHHAVAFETTAAGIAAAHTAGFELVVGVDDGSAWPDLRRQGADRVVGSLAELLEQQVAA
jgi:beta-phosphoglucomutase-like phosphatase (HAD superfamily)